MTLAAWPALFIALGVVLPYIAHRYRRRDQKVVRFAPTAFIEPLVAETRAPSSLEERPLFVLRALLVVAVALLGASPWVRCEGHTLERTHGGSVAVVLVIDDSYSMFAREGGKTHFESAREKAFGILASLQSGDSVAIVRAAVKSEISLGPSMNHDEARALLRTFEPTARGADLDGAIASAAALLRTCPQENRSIYVLSDRIEDEKKKIALPDDPSIRLEFSLPAFKPVMDCALLSASRLGPRVNVTGQCSPPVGAGEAQDRELILRSPKGKIGAIAVRGSSFSVDFPIAGGADVTDWFVEFAVPDAIPESDRLEIVTSERSNAHVVLSSSESDVKSPMEGAWTALQSPIELRRTATLNETSFDGAIGVILDDPLPFTADERTRWQSFADKGGKAMLWLGPRSATPVLGSSFAPLFEGVVAWRSEKREQVQAASRAGLSLDLLGLGYRDVSTSGYAEFVGAASLQPLLLWQPSVPLLLQGAHAWVVTVPLDQANSDITLRPAFLELVNRWAEDLAYKGTHRGEANLWELDVPTVLQKPSGMRTGEATAHRATGPGTYSFLEKGKVKRKENVVPDPREITQNVRGASSTQLGGGKGSGAAPRSISWIVALVVLFLVTLESVLRTQVRRVDA